MFKCFRPTEKADDVLVQHWQQKAGAADAALAALNKQLQVTEAQHAQQLAIQLQGLNSQHEQRYSAKCQVLADTATQVFRLSAALKQGCKSHLRAAFLKDGASCHVGVVYPSQGGDKTARASVETSHADRLRSYPGAAKNTAHTNSINQVLDPHDVDVQPQSPRHPDGSIAEDQTADDIIPASNPEQHMATALTRLEQQHLLCIQGLSLLRRKLDQTEAQNTALQAQLAATETQAKNQLEAFQVERFALESGSASLTELNAELTNQLEAATAALAAAQSARVSAVDAELKAAAAASEATSVHERLAGEAKAAQSALTAASQEMEALTSRVAAMQEESQQNKLQLEELQGSFARQQEVSDLLQQHLADTRQHLAASKAAADAATAQATALSAQLFSTEAAANELKEQLASTQAALAHSQAEEKLKATALASAEQRLAASNTEVAQLRTRLAQAEAEVVAAQSMATTSSAALLAAKRELLSCQQQLASVARDHGKVLHNLGGTDGALAASNTQLQAARTALTQAQQDAEATAQRASVAESGLSSCQALLAHVSKQLAAQQFQASALQSVLRTLAGTALAALMMSCNTVGPASSSGTPSVPGRNSSGSNTGPLSRSPSKGSNGAHTATINAEEQAAYTVALAAEGGLCLQLATAPLGLLNLLATADQQVICCVNRVRVEVDMGAGASWDQVALRASCLAAVLSRCSGLTQLEVAGRSWGGPGAGAGLAAPFLALATLLQAHHKCAAAKSGNGSDANITPGTLSSDTRAARRIQMDCQLMSVSCVHMLCQFVTTAIASDSADAAACALTLSTGPNHPGLLLYSEHEGLDTWYQQMLRTSPHAAVQAGHTPLTSNNLHQQAIAASSPSVHGHSHYAGSNCGSSAPSHVASWVAGSTGARSVAGGQRAHAASTMSSTREGTAATSSTAVAAPSPVDCELVSQGLYAHHMVLVSVVLSTCAHLRRLKLDGNKVCDIGTAILAEGLQHATGLRELSLARNCITKDGVQALCAAFGSCTDLRRLELSDQRAPIPTTTTTTQPLPQQQSPAHQSNKTSKVSAPLPLSWGSGRSTPRVAGPDDSLHMLAQQAQAVGGVGEVLASGFRNAGNKCQLQELGLAGWPLYPGDVTALCSMIATGQPPLRRLVLTAPAAATPAAAAGLLAKLQAAAAARPSLLLNVL